MTTERIIMTGLAAGLWGLAFIPDYPSLLSLPKQDELEIVDGQEFINNWAMGKRVMQGLGAVIGAVLVISVATGTWEN